MLQADAYLQRVFATGPGVDSIEVESIYLDLLGQVGRSLSEVEARAVRKHVAQAALVLPDEMLSQVLYQGGGSAAKWTFKPGAGNQLVAWWRSQDPLPATPENERLREHLDRVAYATRNYPYDRRLTGLDDRGETYVRYGEPGRRHAIRYDDGDFLREVFRFGIHLSLEDFPENEIWTYPHIDYAGYYIFVKDGDYFRIGHSGDLLPPKLRDGVNESHRSKNLTVSLLASLRYVYGQLVQFHADFGGRYAEVEHYMQWQEQAQIGNEVGAVLSAGRDQNAVDEETGAFSEPGRDRRVVGHGAGHTRELYTNPLMAVDAPHDFARSMMLQSTQEDQRASQRRDEVMPDLFSGAVPAEPFSIMVRAARFLDQDGTTRTEIYWAPEAGALGVTGKQRMNLAKLGYAPYDRHVVRLTAVQRSSDYRARGSLQKAYLAPDTPAQEPAVRARTLTVQGDTGLYHVALQWDEYMAHIGPGEQPIELGPRIGISVHRFDSLQALSAGGATLEMSDLRPVTDSGLGDGLLESMEQDAVLPYPDPSVTPDTPLALYFEVYHLAYGSDDKTHYNVEYEITREGRQGALARIFRPGEQDVTSARTSYTGEDRTAREYVYVDLSDAGAEGRLDITVRVTDEVTGQSVARRIHFDVKS